MQGGCLCGRVRYQVASEPTDVINCHCKFCQRATGGAYMVETLFPKEDFQIIRGQTRVYQHVSEGSGKVIHVNFCENCGTKIFLHFDRFPTIVGVYSGTFDDSDWFERSPDNTQHFFLKEAQDGVVLPAGFDVFHEHFWQSEGVQNTPRVFNAHTVVSKKLKEQTD